MASAISIYRVYIAGGDSAVNPCTPSLRSPARRRARAERERRAVQVIYGLGYHYYLLLLCDRPRRSKRVWVDRE
jgi:hypothetical protein